MSVLFTAKSENKMERHNNRTAAVVGVDMIGHVSLYVPWLEHSSSFGHRCGKIYCGLPRPTLENEALESSHPHVETRKSGAAGDTLTDSAKDMGMTTLKVLASTVLLLSMTQKTTLFQQELRICNPFTKSSATGPTSKRRHRSSSCSGHVWPTSDSGQEAGSVDLKRHASMAFDGPGQAFESPG